MPIFDTHCHYNLEPLYSGQNFAFKIKDNDPILNKDWHDHWQKAQDCDIKASLIPGAGLTSSEKAVKIAEQEKNLFASVGVHPLRAQKIELESAIATIEKLSKSKKVVAIGEVGLDYFSLAENENLAAIKQNQEKLFIEQIKLAAKNKLTLIVHARDREDEAYWRILELVENYWPQEQAIIFHCASGPIDYIKTALKIKNSFFGFDGNITFKNAANLRELFNLVQEKTPEKIILETDAPYLAPVPHRGKICEPWMISDLTQFVKQELNANLEQIFNNSLQAFNLGNYKLII